MIKGDPLTQLAFSVFENPGVYALLLGSGISSSAGIMTGWQITIDLIRRFAAGKGVEPQDDWEKWYRSETGSDPNYSTLLAELADTGEERRSIINRYIEPSPEEREDGLKLPTKAHRAIADLVAAGYIRVIITTNFDRLLESALRDVGVEPTIVSSVDGLKGAEPLIHSKCYILKLHGDYKDVRILNTDDELSQYPEEYNKLLGRIIDEHGLLIAGWSGEWDHALRSAILRAPTRRYSTFWTSRGPLKGGAADLAEHRKSRTIVIKDADSFFGDLSTKVKALQDIGKENPQSLDLLAATFKRALTRPEEQINLSDLLEREASELIAVLDKIPPPTTLDQSNIAALVRAYDASAERMVLAAGLLGRHGSAAHLKIMQSIVRTLISQAGKLSSGYTAYVYFRSYAAVKVYTAYALGLLQGERWSDFREFLNSPLTKQHQEMTRFVDELQGETWTGADKNFWRHLEGFDRRRTPFSDHVHDEFTENSTRFLGLVSSFTELYAKFEVLAALVASEAFSTEQFDEAQVKKTAPYNYLLVPFGRSTWDTQNRETAIKQLSEPTLKAALLKAGIVKGDQGLFDAAIQNFNVLSGRQSMWG